MNNTSAEQNKTGDSKAYRVVEDDKSKNYIVVEYANGMRQQVKRDPAEDNRLLARRLAHDSMNEETFGSEAMNRFESIYMALSRPTDPNLDVED